jgi:hypothetical protein
MVYNKKFGYVPIITLNNDNNNNNNNNNNKRKRNTKNPKNNKKFKNDNEIINLLINMDNHNELVNREDVRETNNNCNNPLCDHKDFAEEELNRPKVDETPKELRNIEDLIELGKTFHCKKNKIYYGLNLRLLCNLVPPLTKLKNLVGMKSVKEAMVNQIIFFLQGFNQKDKCGECLDCIYNLPCTAKLNDDMLHTVITGPPGVGKTELGKILGQVYKAMGVLSSGHMHIATRGDLIGKYLGHTFIKTQEFIDKCSGGVMFIDEAYSLGNPEGRDSFSKECIDCINQNLSERRDMLCIIAGYAEDLEKCFFSYNEGLKRRFTFRYDIEGYSGEELMDIFLLKVKNDGWETEIDVKENESPEVIKCKEEKRFYLKQFFNNHIKYFPYFGGDVEVLLLNCKIVHGKRVLFETNKKIFSLYDIETGLKMFVSHRKYDKKEEIPDSIRRMYL